MTTLGGPQIIINSNDASLDKVQDGGAILEGETATVHTKNFEVARSPTTDRCQSTPVPTNKKFGKKKH